MAGSFKPKLESFEHRLVPAALSFRFANGAVGSATFTAPAGVDPTEASQTLDITGLGVVTGGQGYTIDPGATATYEYGVLVGVSATATGPGPDISLSGTTATVVGTSLTATVALDGADTRELFTLGDGTTGAISYTVPWASVDETLTSQYLTPTAFNLNIAGENFASGSGSAYTDAPTLVFANGNFVGFTFTLAPAAGFAYTSVVAGFDIDGNNVIEAIQAGTSQQFIAAPVPQQFVELDFDSVAVGLEYVAKMKFKDGAGKVIAGISVTVLETDTEAGIAGKVAAAINATGKFDATLTGKRLTITARQSGRGWNFLTYDTVLVVEGDEVPVPFMSGPTLLRRGVVSCEDTQIQTP